MEEGLFFFLVLKKEDQRHLKSEMFNRCSSTTWGYGTILLDLVQVIKISSEVSI